MWRVRITSMLILIVVGCGQDPRSNRDISGNLAIPVTSIECVERYLDSRSDSSSFDYELVQFTYSPFGAENITHVLQVQDTTITSAGVTFLRPPPGKYFSCSFIYCWKLATIAVERQEIRIGYSTHGGALQI